MTRMIFALTAGRTGTAWLAEFLGQNMGVEAIHEPLAIEDFGVRMPDIRLMRRFNTYGNDAEVRNFWRRKFGTIKGKTYIEANHTLGKCGLVENLAASDHARAATVVILRRGIVKQAVSYLTRGDFANITVPWQWYLVPGYPLTLVSFQPFEPLGQLGYALWYSYEMAARQAYYQQVFGGRVTFVEADLEAITKPEGAQAFWEKMGGQGHCTLPPPKNTSSTPPPQDLVDQVAAITGKIAFDPDAVAKAAIARGFSFETGADQSRQAS